MAVIPKGGGAPALPLSPKDAALPDESVLDFRGLVVELADEEPTVGTRGSPITGRIDDLKNAAASESSCPVIQVIRSP